MSALQGVKRVSVNVATGRASVEWEPGQLQFARVLSAVEEAGFKPVPLSGEPAARSLKAERRTALKRIGLAGLGMMQTMMFVYCLYAGGAHGIDASIAVYLRVAGMLIATPVLLYSGAPFFSGALRDIRQHTLGMDVPVAAALTLAYVASVVNTLRGSGEIYFDSVTMFIFFLLVGRFVEMTVRHRSLTASEALARSLPTTVTRVLASGARERIAITAIVAGDRLSIPKGAVIPVDATAASGQALIDESLVTGESTPVLRSAFLGGSVNVGHPIEVVARSGVAHSTLATIVALLERAQAQRPSLARATDRAASWFVLVILLLAVAVAAVWLYIDPAHAFSATLAVLVVTCPCALSLATPAAIAAGTARLARLGLLVTRPDAIERLARVDTVVIDKTGTLTSGSRALGTDVLRLGASREYALAMAAALERASSHPIAAAFAPHIDPGILADNHREFAGLGIEAQIAGAVWRIGRWEFVAEIAAADRAHPGSDADIFVGSADGVLARFSLEDAIRPEAAGTIRALRALGLDIAIASGDAEPAVRSAAAALGINDATARLDPEQKLAFVRKLQESGRRILMVGDGINDGPVLAAAHVSCAMAEGSAVAQSAADLLLLNNSLVALVEGIRTARQALNLVRQNLAWAFCYNVAAVPLAALGWVPPWAAAIGMSASSLLVVLNARRLARMPRMSVTRQSRERDSVIPSPPLVPGAPA